MDILHSQVSEYEQALFLRDLWQCLMSILTRICNIAGIPCAIQDGGL